MIIKDIHGHVNFRISHIHAYLGYTIIRDSRVRLITFVHREFNEIAVLISILVIVILFENYSKKVFEFSRQKSVEKKVKKI